MPRPAGEMGSTTRLMEETEERLRPGLGTYGGLFFTTLAALAYEILLTRIFSVTMWYHFAFVAISVALFGLTVGALIVYLSPTRFPDTQTKERLAQASFLFSVTVVVSFLTQLSVPFQPEWTVLGVYSVAFTYLVISVPFIFAGIAVSLALTRFPTRVSRLYAVDLIGAGLGTITLVWLLDSLKDGSSAVLAVAALAAFGAVLFAYDAGLSRTMAAAAVGMLLLAAMAVGNAVSVQDHHPVLRIRYAKNQVEEAVPLYERWNAFSRVRVEGDPTTPRPAFAYGLSPRYAGDASVPWLLLDLDGMSATPLTRFDGDRDSLGYLRYDLTNLVHYLRPNANVVVIGSGGGRDVLAALSFDQPSVTAVEMNGAVLEAVNGYFGWFTGHLDRQPSVRFVLDEGRSFLARSDERYDIIHIPLTDAFAAGSTGAFALTENSLYTVEAFQTFLEHLSDRGVLSVTRWYFGFSAGEFESDRPLEAYRLTSLATAALRAAGAERPRDHLLMVRGRGNAVLPAVATLLISREPFSDADIREVQRVADELQFEVVLTPGEVGSDPLFADIAETDDPSHLALGVQADISAPTDDRPFFFQMARIQDLMNPLSLGDFDSALAKPVLVLLSLAVAILILTSLFILLPLSLTTSRASLRGTLPMLAFFSGIGLGFMFVELSQMQRLVIFLGHPTYALSVGLFAILVSSGVGSLATERLANHSVYPRILWPLAALLVVLLAFGLVTPAIIDGLEGATTRIRILAALAILAPMGFFMGMPFPLGMKVASLRPNAPTVFFWGVNGATSVCGSVLAVAIALGWGISASFWLGAASYAIAVAALSVVVLRSRRSQSCESAAR